MGLWWGVLWLWLWLLAVPAWGDVTVQQVHVGTTGENAMNSLAFPITIGTSTGGALAVLVGFCTEGGFNPEVSSATVRGEALTLIQETPSGTSAARIHLYHYQRLNPTPGSGDVVVNFSIARRAAGGAIVLQGVAASGQLDAPELATNLGDTTSLSVAIASGAGDMAVDLGCKRGTGNPLTMGAQTNRTQRFNEETTALTASNDVIAAGSTRTGTGTLTMNWTMPIATDMLVSGLNVHGVLAAPTGRSLGFLLLR